MSKRKGDFTKCPYCGASVKLRNIDNHIEKTHPRALPQPKKQEKEQPVRAAEGEYLFRFSMPIATENELKFTCARCQKNCCMDIIVPLCSDDVELISQRLNRSAISFSEVRHVLLRDKDMLVLNTKLVKLRDKNKVLPACIFLEKEKNGTNKCAIHDFKPAVCRAYPYFHRQYERADEEKAMQGVNFASGCCTTYDPRCPGVGRARGKKLTA